MSTRIKYFVLAHTHIQAREWAYRNEIHQSEWIYAYSDVQLRGRVDVQIVYLDGWRYNRNRREIFKLNELINQPRSMRLNITIAKLCQREYCERLVSDDYPSTGLCKLHIWEDAHVEKNMIIGVDTGS